MKIAHVVDYFHTDVGYQEYYLALDHARSAITRDAPAIARMYLTPVP